MKRNKKNKALGILLAFAILLPCAMLPMTAIALANPLEVTLVKDASSDFLAHATVMFNEYGDNIVPDGDTSGLTVPLFVIDVRTSDNLSIIGGIKVEQYFSGGWTDITDQIDVVYSINESSAVLWTMEKVSNFEYKYVFPNETPIRMTFDGNITVPSYVEGDVWVAADGAGQAARQEGSWSFSSSGTAGASEVTINFRKVDANSISTGLSGAEYDLYEHYFNSPNSHPVGKELLTIMNDGVEIVFHYRGTVTTGADGRTQIGWDTLSYSLNRSSPTLYLLVEKKAPDGYVLPLVTDTTSWANNNYFFFFLSTATPTGSPLSFYHGGNWWECFDFNVTFLPDVYDDGWGNTQANLMLTNSKPSGFNVTKTFEDPEDSVDTIFSVKTAGGTPLPLTTDNISFTGAGAIVGDGTAGQFTLRHGAKATVLVSGVGNYTVTETVPAGFQSPSVTGGVAITNGAIVQSSVLSPPTLALTNKKVETGSLSVSKVLFGDDTDDTLDFTFIVTFGDDGTYDGVESGAPFTLKGGQSRIISGIPQGVAYTVEETDANTNGYTTTSTDTSGSISSALSEVVFTNTKNSTAATYAVSTDTYDPPEPTTTPPIQLPATTPGTPPDTSSTEQTTVQPETTTQSPEIPWSYSGAPGGSDHYMPPNPSTPGDAIVQDGDGWLELDDRGVPLGRWAWDDTEEMWVFGEAPPMAEMPQTGVSDLSSYCLALLGVSLVSIGIVMKFGKIYKPKHMKE